MVPPMPSPKGIFGKVALAILGAVIIIAIATAVHSCVYNPNGPDEFSVGNASRP